MTQAASHTWDGGERRTAVRLAADDHATIKAYVVDQHGQAVAKLRHAELIDVSATGFSFAAPIGAPAGSTVRIDREHADSIEARVVAVSGWFDDRYRMHAHVTSGSVPAAWVADWSRAA
ncbi:MAG: PilZ domain-containing protein [Planctomycetota bacterium]